MRHMSDKEMAEGLSIWTVYDHPKDVPDYFVARRSVAGANGVALTNDAFVSTDLNELRAELMARGLTRLMRSPEDDPVIMETWL